jgi:hypothetical protein
MKTYLLRGIPADLWRRVKAQAASREESIRDILLRFLESYAGK